MKHSPRHMLRDMRDKMGLTQRQAAQLIGISKSSLGDYESGKTKCPSDHVLLLIADAYNVELFNVRKAFGLAGIKHDWRQWARETFSFVPTTVDRTTVPPMKW